MTDNVHTPPQRRMHFNAYAAPTSAHPVWFAHLAGESVHVIHSTSGVALTVDVADIARFMNVVSMNDPYWVNPDPVLQYNRLLFVDEQSKTEVVRTLNRTIHSRHTGAQRRTAAWQSARILAATNTLTFPQSVTSLERVLSHTHVLGGESRIDVLADVFGLESVRRDHVMRDLLEVACASPRRTDGNSFAEKLAHEERFMLLSSLRKATRRNTTTSFTQLNRLEGHATHLSHIDPGLRESNVEQGVVVRAQIHEILSTGFTAILSAPLRLKEGTRVNVHVGDHIHVAEASLLSLSFDGEHIVGGFRIARGKNMTAFHDESPAPGQEWWVTEAPYAHFSKRGLSDANPWETGVHDQLPRTDIPDDILSAGAPVPPPPLS